jgi:hypothetical protein
MAAGASPYFRTYVLVCQDDGFWNCLCRICPSAPTGCRRDASRGEAKEIALEMPAKTDCVRPKQLLFLDTAQFMPQGLGAESHRIP